MTIPSLGSVHELEFILNPFVAIPSGPHGGSYHTRDPTEPLPTACERYFQPQSFHRCPSGPPGLAPTGCRESPEHHHDQSRPESSHQTAFPKNGILATPGRRHRP